MVDYYTLDDDLDDYYTLFNLSSNCNIDDIKQQWHELSRLHPDKIRLITDNSNHNNEIKLNESLTVEQSREPFLRLLRAYEILSNPIYRLIYDYYGESGLIALQQSSINFNYRNTNDILEYINAIIETRKTRSIQNNNINDSNIIKLQAIPPSTRVNGILNIWPVFGYEFGFNPNRGIDSLKLLGIKSNTDKPLTYYNLNGSALYYNDIHDSIFNKYIINNTNNIRCNNQLRILNDKITLIYLIESERRKLNLYNTISLGINYLINNKQKLQLLWVNNTYNNHQHIKCEYNINLHKLLKLQLNTKYNLHNIHVTLSTTFSRPVNSSTQYNLTINNKNLNINDMVIEFNMDKNLDKHHIYNIETGIAVDKNDLEYNIKLNKVIGKRKRTNIYTKLGLALPHTISINKLNPISKNNNYNDILSYLKPSIGIGMNYNFSSNHSFGLQLTLLYKSYMQAAFTYRYQSFTLHFPINIAPEFNYQALIYTIIVPIVGLFTLNKFMKLIKKQRKYQLLLKSTNQQGKILIQSRHQAKQLQRKLQSKANYISKIEKSIANGLVVHAARYTAECNNRTDPLFPISISATIPLQSLVQSSTLKIINTPRYQIEGLYKPLLDASDAELTTYIWYSIGKNHYKLTVTDEQDVILPDQSAIPMTDKQIFEEYQRLAEFEQHAEQEGE